MSFKMIRKLDAGKYTASSLTTFGRARIVGRRADWRIQFQLNNEWVDSDDLYRGRVVYKTLSEVDNWLSLLSSRIREGRYAPIHKRLQEIQEEKLEVDREVDILALHAKEILDECLVERSSTCDLFHRFKGCCKRGSVEIESKDTYHVVTIMVKRDPVREDLMWKELAEE